MELRPVLVVTLTLAACGAPAGTTTPIGGGGGGTVAVGGVPVVPSFDATRWIPPQPTYAVAAHSVRDAQRAVRGTIGTLGVPFQLTETLASAGLKHFTGLDLLSPEAVVGAGIDAAGGVALFSESLEPTLVVHLTAPDQLKAFIAGRVGASAPHTSTVAGVEVTTIDDRDLHLSWAIDHDWLWLHFAKGQGDTAWFEHSHAGGGGAAPGWQHALAHGKPGVIAFADPHALAAALIAHAPPEMLACAHRFDSIAGLDASIDATDHGLATRISVDLGTGTQSLDASTLAQPGGWTQTAANAPIALAWNLELGATMDFLKPCVGGGPQFDQLRGYGIRSWRAVVLSYTDETTFSGAVSLDLSNAKFLSDYLDQIPLRKHLESDHAFGPYKGHHLSIPTLFAVDYVLTPAVALLARGDGVLDRLVGGAPATRSPLLALDLTTTSMTDPQWHALGHLVDLDDDAIAHLLAWKRLHLGASVEGHELVIEASAERR